jgi:hypothetical protein
MPQHKQGSAASPAADSYWRSFPVLERTLGQENPPLFGQLEATCRQIDAILKSGTAAEKARAREAMAGYARALELYRELVERRDYSMAQASNIANAAGDK